MNEIADHFDEPNAPGPPRAQQHGFRPLRVTKIRVQGVKLHHAADGPVVPIVHASEPIKRRSSAQRYGMVRAIKREWAFMFASFLTHRPGDHVNHRWHRNGVPHPRRALTRLAGTVFPAMGMPNRLELRPARRKAKPGLRLSHLHPRVTSVSAIAG